MTAAALVKVLGGRGDSAPCPVPGHGRGRGDRNHSLSVHDGADGKLLVHCHGGCSQADVWAALQDRGVVAKARAKIPFRNGTLKDARTAYVAPPDRCAEALAIWDASVRALDTPARDYLACRGIVIQPPACIRYHAGINALVALVQAMDGTFSGIQRVYLESDARGTWKTGLYSLGPIKGGAVRLTPFAERLQLTESVEDGMALLQMTGRATWAVPGTAFIPTFEPPKNMTEIVLAPDHDKAGLEAIEKVRHMTHLTYRQLLPPPGMDWCDVLEDHDERTAFEEEPLPVRSWVEDFCDGV